MAVYTVTKLIGAGVDGGPQIGSGYTTLASWESGAPANLTTAEKSAAGTFLVAEFILGETLTFAGSGATGKLLETDSTGAGNGSYVVYGVTTGNPAIADVVTGDTSGATCVLSSGTPTDTGIIWRGEINAASDGFTATTALVMSVTGDTTSSTCYKELTAKTGASFADNASVQTNALRYNEANGCYIRNDWYGNYCVTVSADDFKMSRVQVSNANATGGFALQAINTGGQVGVIEKCILDGKYHNIGTLMTRGTGCKVINTLVIQRGVGASSSIAQCGTGSQLYGSTFVGVGASKVATGLTDYSTDPTVQNCAIFGCTNITNSTFTATTSYGDDADASPPTGVTTAAWSTANFANITLGTHDLRLVTGSALLNAGTTDTTNTPTDIAGTNRPQSSAYDVGCWELVVAAGGGNLIAGKLIAGSLIDGRLIA